jgi:hypothetical protein
VLFSDDEISALINDQFEPVWVSVRDVPTVTIDFGQGNIIKRTLHGNVATYVCESNGQVLDVLPGIYAPQAYQQQLRQLVMLHRFVQQQTAHLSGSPEADVQQAAKYVLQSYHEQRANAIQSDEDFQLGVEYTAGRSIMGIERSIKVVLNPVKRMQARGASRATVFYDKDALTLLTSSEDQESGLMRQRINRTVSQVKTAEIVSPESDRVATREAAELAEDTRINENQRRLLIHGYLAKSDRLNPDQMKKWLYREVLHADLDDPYLGLGKVLFDTYPFAAEDRASNGTQAE